MIISIKSAITFDIPKEKELMDRFAKDNPDWYCVDTISSRSMTFKRSEIFQIGTDEEEDE